MSSKTTDFLSGLLETFGKEAQKISSGVNDLFNKTDLGTKVPAINILETGDAFIVEVAAPGLSKEHFRLKLEPSEEDATVNILTVGAKVKREDEDDENPKKYLKQEFDYHTFRRSFEVPVTADDKGIGAAYKDGILRVTLPKKDEARSKPAKNIDIW